MPFRVFIAVNRLWYGGTRHLAPAPRRGAMAPTEPRPRPAASVPRPAEAALELGRHHTTAPDHPGEPRQGVGQAAADLAVAGPPPQQPRRPRRRRRHRTPQPGRPEGVAHLPAATARTGVA